MPSRSFSPFRHRGYRLVWGGALVSNIGTWMETTALSYYVADTSSAGASGLVAAAGLGDTVKASAWSSVPGLNMPALLWALIDTAKNSVIAMAKANFFIIWRRN